MPAPPRGRSFSAPANQVPLEKQAFVHCVLGGKRGKRKFPRSKAGQGKDFRGACTASRNWENRNNMTAGRINYEWETKSDLKKNKV